MIPLPGPPDSSNEDVIESEAAVWGFLIALFVFKLVTVIVIFWQLRTWESGLVLGSTLWYWFPPLILLAAGPVLFYYRLRKVRARREALQRAEWMLDDHQPSPAIEHPKRS